MSSEGGGGSSDDQQEGSVEYSGEKGDGVVYLIFGVISIVVIVVIVLLVVFLMSRHNTHTTEPLADTSSTGRKCTNPCGEGRVCLPDSKRDADGCFVQDCHCYDPNAAHICSNPCNATGQVCHFGSPLDVHGCYMPSCKCVTCPQYCQVDKKCDPNSPAGPDGCPMLGCTCVPMMCPARCPVGRQCAPHAPTDANGCFEQDCMCVPVTVATSSKVPTKEPPVTKSCPVVCPVGKQCHKLQPVDASGCPLAPCTCISDLCPRQCPPGEICDLTAPLDAAGCFKNGCRCVPDGSPLSASTDTTSSVKTGDGSSSTTPGPTNATSNSTQSRSSVARALEDSDNNGKTNGTHSNDGVSVLKRSFELPESGNGSLPVPSPGVAGSIREGDDRGGSRTTEPEKLPGGEPRASDEGTTAEDSRTAPKEKTGGATQSEPVAASATLEEGAAPGATSVAPQDLPSDGAVTKSREQDASGGPTAESANEKATGVATSEQGLPEDAKPVATGESASTAGAAEGELRTEGAETGEEPAGAKATAGVSSADGAEAEHGESRIRRSFEAAGKVPVEPVVISLGTAEANGAFDAFNLSRKLAEALFKKKSSDHSAATEKVPLLIVPSGDPSSTTFLALVTRESRAHTNNTR